MKKFLLKLIFGTSMTVPPSVIRGALAAICYDCDIVFEMHGSKCVACGSTAIWPIDKRMRP